METTLTVQVQSSTKHFFRIDQDSLMLRGNSCVRQVIYMLKFSLFMRLLVVVEFYQICDQHLKKNITKRSLGQEVSKSVSYDPYTLACRFY